MTPIQARLDFIALKSEDELLREISGMKKAQINLRFFISTETFNENVVTLSG